MYSQSSALIFASLGEGFGLPLIEAAQKKLPVIIRDIPVFKEIAQEHAWYFSGEAPADIAKAVEDWLALYEQNAHPRSENINWLTSEAERGISPEKPADYRASREAIIAINRATPVALVMSSL